MTEFLTIGSQPRHFGWTGWLGRILLYGQYTGQGWRVKGSGEGRMRPRHSYRICFFCAGRVSNISCDINSGCNMPFATQSCSLYLFCSDSALNFVARLANNCFSCKQCGSICTAFKFSVKCASSCEVTAQASPIKAQQRWNLCVWSCDVKGDNLRTRSQISLGHT